MPDFHPDLIPWFIAALMLGTFFCLELGYLFGTRETKTRPELFEGKSGPIEASIFALLGLLLAFTFSAAQGRMEQRRQQIINEANDISTAYLRMDLLPESAQPEMRQAFREYVDTRIAVYKALPDIDKAFQELEKSKHWQKKIWSGAITALKDSPGREAVVVLPALNQMFDITTTRTAMAKMHTPATIFILLFVIALLCASVAGYGMSKSPGRNWFHRLAFIAVVSTTVFVILDLEFPRRGLINISATDHLLIEVRESMKN